MNKTVLILFVGMMSVVLAFLILYPLSPVLPPTYAYWGNQRGLFQTGNGYGHPDMATINNVGEKNSARFTCPMTCTVKGVYGELVIDPSLLVEVRWGVQADDGFGLPNGTWLGFWIGVVNEVRPLHLFQEKVKLVEGQVYHIVLELVTNLGGYPVSYHAYFFEEKFQSYDWSSDEKLACLVYKGGNWDVVVENGQEVVPCCCVVTEDESFSFPIAGIDLWYIQANRIHYTMNNFPIEVYADQLVLKLLRVGDLGNISLSLLDMTDGTTMVDTTILPSDLPYSDYATVLRKHYVWHFGETVRLKRGGNYELRIVGHGCKFGVCIVACCQPYQWGGPGAWFNDEGSFYGHDFFVSRLNQYTTDDPISNDVVFAFKVFYL